VKNKEKERTQWKIKQETEEGIKKGETWMGGRMNERYNHRNSFHLHAQFSDQ
jgi:hypothetical protein